MKLRSILLAAAVAAGASSASGQSVKLDGFVSDSATGRPLSHVRVELLAEGKRPTVTAYTDAAGHFAVNPLSPGLYAVRLTRIGYFPVRISDVEVIRSGSTLRFLLAARGIPMDPVVVSASRSDQTQLDAPASVSVIDREAIESDLRFSPLEQIRYLPGVDLASKGLMQHTFEVRGPRAPTPGALLMLTDYRYAELPSIGLNVSYLVPVTREDIERIELVRGPAAALYGPGAPRGVLHVITRSPFESTGGAASITAGARSVLQGTARYAALVRPRLAFAISADYLQGEDWESVDSVELQNRQAALAKNADPDTLHIGRRDYFIRRAGGEVRVDWRPGPYTEVVTKTGIADAVNAIDFTGLGAVQLKSWSSWYVQSLLQHARLMVNAVLSANDAGDTYYLRTGAPLVEQSRMVAFHVQHGGRRRSVDFVYGADLRATNPRTGGTIHGTYEDDDFLAETGSYAQATTDLTPRLQFVTALRVDHHSQLRDVVLSPRAAFVYKPGRRHALRATYNRAFNSPPPSSLFLDVRVSSLPGGIPYAVRQQAIPRDGFTFRRDCNGLCMRSPFSAGGSEQYVPADATVLWAEMVAFLAQRGIRIEDIPAPSSTDVTTMLGLFNQTSRTFASITPAAVRDVAPLRRQITNVFELGYKGALRSGAMFAADLHATRTYRRIAGGVVAVTPNVFFDRTSLERYLANFRGASAAAQIAAALAQVPVGTVSPSESPYPTDILLVARQGQSYTLWGVDLATDLPLGSRASTFATYSWVSYDSVSSALPEVPVVLSIPKQKVAVALEYRSATLLTSVRGRYVGLFRTGGGSRAPGVPGYGVMDVSTTFRVPPERKLSLSAEIQNVFNRVHSEFPGAAPIGRLAVVRTRIAF